LQCSLRIFLQEENGITRLAVGLVAHDGRCVATRVDIDAMNEIGKRNQSVGRSKNRELDHAFRKSCPIICPSKLADCVYEPGKIVNTSILVLFTTLRARP